MKRAKKIFCTVLAVLFCCSALQILAFADEYSQTKAKKVSVYVTLSSDGMPILSNDADSTVLAGAKVEVPYFDLDLYGLSDYYRFETAKNGGKYISGNVIERPTALHLVLYLLERYYIGLPAAECGKGISGVLNYKNETPVYSMNGSVMYTGGTRQAISMFGTPTALYLSEFWGHDENMLYYRNHAFPEMEPGKGATLDYILLSDGDEIDIAMFTDWEFYRSGRLLQFGQRAYNATVGKPVSLSVLQTSLSESVWVNASKSPCTDAELTLFDSTYTKICTLENRSGKCTYTFENAGTYYVLATEKNAGKESANTAPGICTVTVGETEPQFTFQKSMETVKVPLFTPYSKAKFTPKLTVEGVDYKNIRYTSDNAKVTVSGNGEVGNKGLFSRKAVITAEALAADGSVLQTAKVTVIFYKFGFSLSRLKSPNTTPERVIEALTEYLF